VLAPTGRALLHGLMHKLYCDFETYSPVPITNGTHAYAEQAEVMLWAYALDDERPRCWDLTTTPNMPTDLATALADPGILTIWHNGGMFDRVVLRYALPQIYDTLPIERWYDTMVQALSHSLPGSLDKLCEVFNLPQDQRKQKTGKQLIQLFCKPPAATLKRPRATCSTHPEQWAQFISYAMSDIDSMREVHKRMPMWNYQPDSPEMRLWYLDQTINMRGIKMDVDLAQAAIRGVDLAQHVLAQRTVELTDGAVRRATQRNALLAHLLAAYGVELPDMQKSTLERRIDDPTLPRALRELLAIRLQASTSSTSKYKTLIKSVSTDGRLRGTLQFCGANRTGRWAHRGFQPGNMPRPTLPQVDIDLGVRALKVDCAHLITDNVMELTSNTIRGCIVAPLGKKLVVSDLSNIEGRALAWLAQEDWKLKAFADYDQGIGHDIYKLAYAKSFNVKPESVTKDQRQIGKVKELMLGYQGGVGAYITGALTYRIDLEAMADGAYPLLPPDLKEEAEDFYAWTVRNKRSVFGLTRKVFVTCDTFKRAWRTAHPRTASLWSDLEGAVTRAVTRPGVTLECRRLRIRRDGNWLRIRLPSGRSLCYPSPQVDEVGKFSYMGVNQYTRKWSRIRSYGGKLVENITQAVARDVMAANMLRIEEAGYKVVLTVHDEVLTETPNVPKYNAKNLSELLANAPEWAHDLPLAAAGFETLRYRKD
jgi:DNA polymerase